MKLSPGPVQNVDWLYELRNGRAFQLGSSQAAVALSYSFIQLFNPVGSGKTILLYNVNVQIPVAGYVVPTFFNTALATDAGAGINLNAGSAAAAGHVRTEAIAGDPSVSLGSFYVPAGISTPMGQPWACVLDAGEGFMLRSQLVNQTIEAVYQWVER